MKKSNIGKHIKELRNKKGLTQKELAMKINVSNQLISKWETGQAIPSIEYFDSLCNALGCSTTEIMDGISLQNSEGDFWIKNQKAPWWLKKVYFYMLGLFVLCVFGTLTYFCIIPALKKETYLQQIDTAIVNTLNIGYYNIRISSFVDGKERGNVVSMYGYVDETGVNYYNSYTNEAVKNGVYAYSIYISEYEDTKINTTEKLLKSELKKMSNNGIISDIDEHTYIRKRSSGYYIELPKQNIEESAGIKVVGNISGEIRTEDDCFKYMIIKFDFYGSDDKDKKQYNLKTKLEFLHEKKEVEDSFFVNKEPRFTDYRMKESEYVIDYLSNNKKLIENPDDIVMDLFKDDGSFALSQNSKLLISKKGDYYFSYNSTIYFFDESTLKVNDKIDLNVNNNFWNVNGYKLVKDDNDKRLYVYNDLDELLYEMSISSYSILKDSFYAYNNYLYYIKQSGYDYTVNKINMTSNQQTSFNFYIGTFLHRSESTILPSLFGYNKNYLWYYSEDNTSKNNMFVWDIENQNRIISDKGFIEFVSSKGELLYKRNKDEDTIYVYNSDIYFQNVKSVFEHQDKTYIICYTSDYSKYFNIYSEYYIYVFDNGLVIDELSPNNNETERVVIEDLYFDINSSYIRYNETNNTFYSFSGVCVVNSKVYNKKDIGFSSPKIIGYVDGKLVVAYAGYISNGNITRNYVFILIYDGLNFNRANVYTIAKDFKMKSVGDCTYVYIKELSGEERIYKL